MNDDANNGIMNVNGDTCVLRHGRSTSKVSIYDYPEHLNPFYEDENHKRLRFWKVGKNKNGESRRSSFSLEGLRDMWTFKSFRSKKKSSTLGINKTSESPPYIRRDLSPVTQHYGSYDPKLRHTTNGFDRNVPYRSSLQDMRASNTIDRIGFNRNDRYRSTVQTQNPATSYGSLSRRYIYGGSVTPQPCRSNFDNNSENGYMSRGSSQTSVYSTNPFEGDDDDNDIVVVPGSAKRPNRKKRRAPPPPNQVDQIKEESPSSEVLEISNLAAQIESFVNTSNEDEDNEKPIPKKLSSPPPEIIIEEYQEPSGTKTNEKLVIVEEQSKGADTKLDVTVDDNKEQGEFVSNKNEDDVKGSKDIIKDETNFKYTKTIVDQESNVTIPKENLKEPEKLVIEEQNISITNQPLPTYQNSVETTVITPPRRARKHENMIEKHIITSDIEQKVLNKEPLHEEVFTSVDNIELPDTPQPGRRFIKETSLTPSDDTNISIDLRISESKDDLTSEASDVSNCKVEYTPLKDSSPDIECALPRKNPESLTKPINLDTLTSKYYSDDNLNESIYRKPTIKLHDLKSEFIENGTSPQRRSVKDIIESINKSQSLLKINQPDQNLVVDHNANQPFKTLKERETEIKRMLEELDKPSNRNSKSLQDDNELDDLVDSLNNNVSNNNNIFRKCVVTKTEARHSREQSPTVSNLDWNPIPKPKRSKNFN